MTDNKQNSNKGHTAAAGIVGAVVGAGVAVAATKVLSDKKARKRVADTVTAIKDTALDSLHNAQATYGKIRNEIKEDVEQGKKEAKKMIDKKMGDD